jgi:hypothetical protein
MGDAVGYGETPEQCNGLYVWAQPLEYKTTLIYMSTIT